MDIQTAWEKARQHLTERLGKTTFDTWIAPLNAQPDGEGRLIILAPDNFFKDWVESHYLPLLQEAAERAFTKKMEISLAVNTLPVASATEGANKKEGATRISTDQPSYAGLNPRYTFDNFVIGSSNRHAHAYSLAVSEAPAKTYNPLFIYGGVGLGKTHLMQAICHQIVKNSPGAKICYLTSERFTNELIDAIQHHSTSSFRQQYRNKVDVLVVDDIQFIAGKESTQEEFFHTFNALYDAHKQIIISSDRPPKEISNLQDRLVSRFSWGLATDIQPPDLETRVAILKKKIEREPVAVPQEVIFFIAQLIKTNIRELEGALIRTIAYSLLEEKPITLDLAKEVLKDLLREPQKLITVDFIQRCVAEEFGIALADFRAKKRNKTVVLPRQIAMYLSRELTDLSLPEIGDFFGGKDHTTVLHSVNKIKEDISHNEILKNKIERVLQIIKQ
ncbi:MAG: chromosomal replication initiator protein DnaA [Candidatus Omnitrophica bacterium]|nr:chromosomal replication initiator protein DnaA [Candidatus Omnitrophota bacterium]